VQLRNQLADAQSCLETVVRRDAQAPGDAEANGVVLTPMDEPLYWRSVESTVSFHSLICCHARFHGFLGNLHQVQRRWIYLSPLFSRGALPQEQHRFRRIDEYFRQVMSEVESDSLVMSMANRSGLADRLVVTIDQLERCQKARIFVEHNSCVVARTVAGFQLLRFIFV
jgi:hypothetical protein